MPLVTDYSRFLSFETDADNCLVYKERFLIELVRVSVEVLEFASYVFKTSRDVELETVK